MSFLVGGKIYELWEAEALQTRWEVFGKRQIKIVHVNIEDISERVKSKGEVGAEFRQKFTVCDGKQQQQWWEMNRGILKTRHSNETAGGTDSGITFHFSQ